MDPTNLVLPVVLWDAPPSHVITSLVMTLDKRYLITGSRSGMIGVWTAASKDAPPDEARLKPHMMLVGCDSPITALALTSRPPTDGFASLSLDGTLCVWDHQAGVCVASVRHLLGNMRCPTRMVSLPDRRHVAISGQTADIKIVDLWAMQVVKRIQAHDDWISALCSCDLGGPELHPFLLSLDASGILNFNSVLYLTSDHEPPVRSLYIPTGDEDTDEHDINADDIRIPSGPCLSVCISPAAKTLVVVTSKSWLLYTASNTRLVFKVDSPEGTSWRGASYVHDLQVIVWAKNGVAYLYDLPKQTNLLEPLVISRSNVREPVSIAAEPAVEERERERPHLSVPRVSSLPSFLGTTLVDSAKYATRKFHHYEHHPSVSSSSRAPSPLPTESIEPFHTATSSPRPPRMDMHLFSSDPPGPPAGKEVAKTLEVAIADLEPQGQDEQLLANTLTTPLVQTAEDAPHASEEIRVSSVVETITQTTPAVRSMMAFPSSSEASEDKDVRKTIGAWDETLVMGDESGAVALWHVSEGRTFIMNSHQDLNESCEIHQEDGLAPWACAKLSDGWKGIVDPTAPAVVSSLIVEDTLLLVRGYENGDISVAGLPSQKEPPRFIRRAHSARVTSLISAVVDNAHLLVSAGADCVIKVWNLVTGDLVRVFAHHTAPITHLIRPRSREGLRAALAGDVFISVSKDKSVGLFSLSNMNCVHVFGGHPAQIRNVGWRAEQDYIIVQCDDGSVSVWEIGSGMLESRIYGDAAEEIMHNTPYLLRHGRGTLAEATGAVTSYTVQSGEFDSPLQVLNLHIKEMVQDLYKMKFHKTNKITPSQDDAPNGRPGKQGRLSISTNSGRTPSSEPIKRRSLTPDEPSSLAQSSAAAKAKKPSSGPPPTGTTKSEALLTSTSYLLFSYLIPWHTTEKLDPICIEQLLLHPPSPPATFGLLSADKMLGILVPSSAQGNGRWQSSDRMTALYTLAAVTFTNCFLRIGNENASSQLLTHFCNMVPEITLDYVEPSLLCLTTFYQDSMEDVVQAARAVFGVSVARMLPDALASFVHSEATLVSMMRPSEERENRVLMLAILGSEKPECLDTTTTQEVVRVLFEILKQKDNPRRLAAAALLGKAFSLWRNTVKDTKSLIQSLFALTLMKETPSVSTIALNSLTSIGALETRSFLDAVSSIITRTGASTRDRAEALMLISHLVNEKSPHLIGHVGKLVETVMNAIDPNVPDLREACFGPAKIVLHAIVSKFPMVSFNQETQRLAVGTSKGVILIYDLKTASRWHVLEKGHTGSITAVAYNKEGDKLASYSLVDGRVVVWATKTSFFEYFAAAPSPQRTIDAGKADRAVSDEDKLKVQLLWMDSKKLQLLRNNNSTVFKL